MTSFKALAITSLVAELWGQGSVASVSAAASLGRL